MEERFERIARLKERLTSEYLQPLLDEEQDPYAAGLMLACFSLGLDSVLADLANEAEATVLSVEAAALKSRLVQCAHCNHYFSPWVLDVDGECPKCSGAKAVRAVAALLRAQRGEGLPSHVEGPAGP